MMDDAESSQTPLLDGREDWYELETPEEDAADREEPIDEYELNSAPNDFNVSTLVDFVDAGTVIIPGFQRNYVWDMRRASRLIESLILGIPVPQLFWYEKRRNEFLVIDGQQRLMSIYYFTKGRFPVLEKRPELRRIFDENGGRIPKHIFEDDNYFKKFNLTLPSGLPSHPNKFNGLNYSTLGDFETQFKLRTVRNVIIKQIAPKDNDSVIYNIFYRLNWGGVNVTPQEIRISLYHSAFFEMLFKVNIEKNWRNFIGPSEPDLHVKDIEFLLRAFAMAISGPDYRSSMNKFLNDFSKKAQQFQETYIAFLKAVFLEFLRSCKGLPENTFKINNKFSVALFEAVFFAMCRESIEKNEVIEKTINSLEINNLKADSKFSSATKASANTKNVEIRLARARELVSVSV
jgi:hypothetical protein